MRTSDLAVGRRVRSELSLRGLVAADLGEVLRLAPNSVGRRLRGVTSFSAEELAAISDWLDVPIERFFDPLPEEPKTVPA